MSYIFTSESVSAGHPDKVCDQISDAVLDAYLAEDPNSRVACETMIKNNMVYIAGEITSLGSPDLEPIVRKTINDIVKEVTQSLEEGIGSVRILPALGKMALGAAAVKGVSSYLGRKSGEKSIKKTEPKKPSLIKKIKDATDAKNKAIEEM